MSDVRITDGGSLVGFEPVSETAKEWFAENVGSEGWQWLGPVLYVEHRCAKNLLCGLADAGLEHG